MTTEHQPSSLRQVSRNLRGVSLCTIASRVLGLFRDMAMAARFGNGPILDAFTLAFRIPNLSRALLGEGTLATAFLPAFVRVRTERGEAAAGRFASAVLVMLATVLAVVALVCELLLGLIAACYALSAEADLLRQLTMLMLPYVILICLTALLAAMLQALGEFIWPALIPVVLNLVWLLSLWFVVPLWTNPHAQIVVMAVSLLVAGVAQLVFPLPILARRGYRFGAHWREDWPEVQTLLWQIIPVLLAMSVTQLNTLFDSLVAWLFAAPESGPTTISWLWDVDYPLAAGAASALYFGQRLYQFPLGVFGVALGTVLYPLFAAHTQRGDLASLRNDIALGARLVLAIGIPAGMGLVLIAEPLASLCFEYGRFDADDARQTSRMIAAYGSGVWAYCGLLIVQRAFYALGDRMTPLRLGFLAMVFNVTLNLSLIWFVGGVGLAISTALVAMLQCLGTAWLLERRLPGIPWRGVLVTALKTIAATAAMTMAVWAISPWLPVSSAWASRAMHVLVPLCVAMLVYLGSASVLRLQEPWQLLRRSPRPLLDESNL